MGKAENKTKTADEEEIIRGGRVNRASESEYLKSETETFARGCCRGFKMFRRTFSCSQSKWKWVFICTILTIVATGALTWVIPIFISTLSEDIPNGKRDPYIFASFAIVVVLLSLIILGSMYLLQRLSLSFRWGLQLGLHSLYFQGNSIYDLNNLKSDDLDNIDQRLTTDLSIFTSSCFVPTIGASQKQLSLIGSLIALGIALALVLENGVSWYFTILILWSTVWTIVLFFITNKMSIRTDIKQESEGEFRLAHARAIEFSESIAFYSGESNELQNAEIKYQRLESSYTAYLPWVYAQQGMNVFLIQSSVIVAASVYALQSRCTPGAPQGAKVALLQLIMYNNIMTATMALINAISMLGPAAGFANRVGKLYEALSELYVPDSQQNMLCQGEILSNPNEVVVENLTCATPDGSKVLFKNISFRVKKGNPSLSWGRVERARQACSAYLVDCGRFSKDLCRSQAQ